MTLLPTSLGESTLGPSMHKLLYLMCLGTSTALAQAVAPLPVPAPASTVVRPLPATPTGTGLYVPRTSIGEPLNVERSPNQRVLPPTQEPGLWAADDMKPSMAASVARPDLLQLPTSADPVANKLSARCLLAMANVMEASNLQTTWGKLTADHQRCTAAYLLKRCADERAREKIALQYMSPGERPALKERLERQRKEESDALKRRSAELVSSECRQGAGLGYGLVIQLGDAYAYHLEMSR